MRFLAYLTVSLLFFTTFLSPLRAQEFEQLVDLSIQTNPVEVRAQTPVTLRAISYSIDLSQAFLTWTYDGRTVTSGTGKTSISVTAPQNGAVAIASVTATFPGLSPVSATMVLQPGSVDLLWEGADAAVPPFYKGRSLPAVGGLVRFVAIPANGAGSLASYEWSRGDNALPDASGYGKSSIIIENTVFQQNEKMTVNVSSPTFSGKTTKTANLFQPFALAYKKKNGFVDYNTGSQSTVSILGDTVTLRFEPFFFSVSQGIEEDLAFSFTSGDQTIFGSDQENELRFSRPESGTGEVTLKLTTTAYSLQHFNRTFSLLFQ